MMFAAGAVGTDVESTVAYQIFTLMLALLVLAFGFSWFFRARFSLTRMLPRFGTAGQVFELRREVEKPDATNANWPDVTGQSQRPAPVICGMENGSACRESTHAFFSSGNSVVAAAISNWRL